MEAIIKLNINELSTEFISKLKETFPGLEVEIRLRPSEVETEFILNNPKFAEELKKRIDRFEENPDNVINLKAEDLL